MDLRSIHGLGVGVMARPWGIGVIGDRGEVDFLIYFFSRSIHTTELSVGVTGMVVAFVVCEEEWRGEGIV